jgi:hypothetical protein
MKKIYYLLSNKVLVDQVQAGETNEDVDDSFEPS